MYDGLKNLEVPRRPSRGRRAARRGVMLLAILSLLVSSGGFYVYYRVNDTIGNSKDPDIEVAPEKVGQPINVLVLGSDARGVLSREERRRHPELRGPAGKRSDTIILIHISKRAERAVAVSFPRDLRVAIPGHGTQKLNAAYSIGGPNLVIETITELTGIAINHYVEINFSSFREIVDSVGGVEVCLKRAYNDRKSGLVIPKPGCYEMDGRLALAYVRARYIEDGSDLSRIDRQQRFMRALMRKVKSVKFLLDPRKVLNLAEAIGKGVVLSNEVDLGLARGVANKLSGSDSAMDFRVVPNVPQYIGGVSYVLPRQPDARRLFAALRNDTAVPNVGKTSASLPHPSDVAVTVLNGTGKNGQAALEAERLRQLGFRITRIDTNDSVVQRTRLRFDDEAELKVKLLEEEYPYAEVAQSKRALRSDVVVILGTDYLESKAATGPDG